MGYRIVRMTKELFQEFFTEGWTVPNQNGERIRCVKGLPEGAILEAVSMELFFDSDGIALKFSHPSWPDRLPGDAIQHVDVQYSTEVVAHPDGDAELKSAHAEMMSAHEELRASWKPMPGILESDNSVIVSGGES